MSEPTGICPECHEKGDYVYDIRGDVATCLKCGKQSTYESWAAEARKRIEP